MLQVSLPLMGIAGRYVPQNLELVDTSCLECAQQLSRDRRAYAEAERWVQVRANRRLVPETAFRHCQHSQLESFRPVRSNCMWVWPQTTIGTLTPSKTAKRRSSGVRRVNISVSFRGVAWQNSTSPNSGISRRSVCGQLANNARLQDEAVARSSERCLETVLGPRLTRCPPSVHAPHDRRCL